MKNLRSNSSSKETVQSVVREERVIYSGIVEMYALSLEWNRQREGGE